MIGGGAVSREFPFGLVRLVAFIHGREKRRAEPDARGDGEHGVQTAEHGAVQHHLTQPRVHREFGEVVAQRREFVGGVHRVEFHQRSKRGRDGALRRRFDRLREKLAHVAQAKHLDLQAKRVEGRAQNLGGCEIRQRGFARARVEMEAVALSHATRATSALAGGRAAAPRGDEGRHARHRVVLRLADAARVDDEDDVVDGDGRLGDVGRHDDFSNPRRGFGEGEALFLGRQRGVQRDEHEPTLDVLEGSQQTLVQPANLRHARQENQDGAFLVLVRDERHQKLDELEVDLLLVNRLQTLERGIRVPGVHRARLVRHVPAILRALQRLERRRARRRAASAAPRQRPEHPPASPAARGFRAEGEFAIRLAHVPRRLDGVLEAILRDGKRSPRNLHAPARSRHHLLEVRLEQFGVDRRGHGDESEIVPSRRQPSENHQQKIGEEIALVHLVNDDVTHPLQIRVALQPTK